MILGNDRIVECPHCGGRKALISILSGNTIGATYWSDGKMVAPMLWRNAQIQRCPSCGHYAFLNRLQTIGFAKGSLHGGSGTLPYELLKEAAAELLPTEVVKDEIIVRTELLWAYNELYVIGNRNIPAAGEMSYMHENIERLADLVSDENVLFRAELLREIGRFDDCIGLLEPYSSDRFDLNARILKKARMKNPAVFGWMWENGAIKEINVLKEEKKMKKYENHPYIAYDKPETREPRLTYGERAFEDEMEDIEDEI